MSGLGVVIVTWRSRATIAACLDALPSRLADGRVVSVVVVDNGSADGTIEFVTARYPQVTTIALSENLGFAQACNRGAAGLGDMEYLCFLNPDTVASAEALGSLATFLDEQPFVGIVGPRFLGRQGELQPSARRFPTAVVAVLLLTKLQRIFPHYFALRRYYMTGFTHETLRMVDQVMGACLFTRRSLFRALGGFDERYFIWFEDVDLCRRAKATGLLTFFVPWAIVRHIGGHSFAQRTSLWRQWFFSQSLRRYFFAHHHVSVAFVVALTSYVLLPLYGSAAVLHALFNRARA